MGALPGGAKGLLQPLMESQIDAAAWLHDRLPGWVAADRALAALKARHPEWDEAACYLKATAIDGLYATDLRRRRDTWTMAQHICGLMPRRPSDPHELVEKIGDKRHTGCASNHFSFASKFVNFFVDDTVPLKDDWATKTLTHHLGAWGAPAANDWRRHVARVGRLRALVGLCCSARCLDHYLWLSGMYRERQGTRGTLDRGVEDLFVSECPDVQWHLQALLGRTQLTDAVRMR